MKRYRGKKFHKRPEPMTYVRKLGMKMMSGEWKPSKSAFVTVTPGTIISGQHRIRALAEEALQGLKELT